MRKGKGKDTENINTKGVTGMTGMKGKTGMTGKAGMKSMKGMKGMKGMKKTKSTKNIPNTVNIVTNAKELLPTHPHFHNLYPNLNHVPVLETSQKTTKVHPRNPSNNLNSSKTTFVTDLVELLVKMNKAT